MFKETHIYEIHNPGRHSGACQNPVKIIAYWMLVFTSMTEKPVIQIP